MLSPSIVLVIKSDHLAILLKPTTQLRVKVLYIYIMTIIYYWVQLADVYTDISNIFPLLAQQIYKSSIIVPVRKNSKDLHT